jgi:hypothetical protein
LSSRPYLSGTGSGALLGSSTFTAVEMPQMTTVPNRLVGTFVLAAGADTLRGSYDVISTPPQPSNNITVSGPYVINNGAGRFRCAKGNGTMTGSADLGMRTGENIFNGTVTTP